jgi:hypothetical protein
MFVKPKYLVRNCEAGGRRPSADPFLSNSNADRLLNVQGFGFEMSLLKRTEAADKQAAAKPESTIGTAKK